MSYLEYKGRSLGRLMRFLYEYYNYADHCVFTLKENPKITYLGEPFANYEWDGDSDIPTFTFLGDYDFLNDIQKRKKEEIIEIDRKREEIFEKKE